MTGKRFTVKPTGDGWSILRDGKEWRRRKRAESSFAGSTHHLFPGLWEDGRRTESALTVARRLVVELNQRSDNDLTHAADAEQTTKTTIVNRAIQVYEMVRANQAAGGHIIRVQPDGTSEKVTFT